MEILKRWMAYPRWSPVQTEEGPESKESLLHEDTASSISFQLNSVKSSTSSKLFFVSLSLNLLAIPTILFFLLLRSTGTVQNAAIRETSWFSPVIEDIDLPLHDTLLNGTLFPGPNPSLWRLEPGPQADAAWNQFEEVKPFVLTKEQVIKLGKDPTITVKYEDAYWHMGDDAYVGALDVFHQIHCLNVLRKEAFADFGQAGEERPSHPKKHWIHLRHCTDILMQNLMCHADTEIMTYQWMETQEYPYPDMSINRKCKNLETLVQWQEDNSIDVQKYDRWPRPKGVKEVPVPSEYWEIFAHDQTDSHKGH